MKRILFLLALWASAFVGYAQTVHSQIVENGGTGPYKAVVVGDASCPAFTIYRPQDLDAAGKLPVILYGNGGCANSTVEIRFFLNEIASYGYLAIGIGPYEEDDPNAKWKDVLLGSFPEGKKVVLANGEELKAPSPEEIQARAEASRKRMEALMAERAKNPDAPVAFANATYAKQLLEAMDWLTEQNANPASEYYHKLDLDKVAAMGHSCGGSQVLGVAHDPRIKTGIMLNSGIGDMEMQGATKETLENLHTPMLYLIGGPSDVAFPNSALDFQRIKNVPVVMINTTDGHLATFYEKSGGAYAVTARKWLDWQLKGDNSQAPFFLDDAVLHEAQPTWNVDRKNWTPAGPARNPGMRQMSREEMEEMFRRMNTPPSDPAYKVEKRSCTSAGNKIYGEAFIPVAPGKHPAVILSHGYGGTHSGFYVLADKLAKAGYVAYCYDFAGGSPRSQSEGRTEDMSILTERQNLEDVLDMVRGWDCVDKKNVFLLGESQGGCVSAITAPYVKKKINAILLTYPALCIADDGYALYPTLADVPETVNFMGMNIGKPYYELYYKGYDIYKELSGYQGDVLIVHGTEDTLVKPEYSARASNLYKNCELHLIFGAGHGFRGPEQVELYHGYIMDFLQRHLK